MQARNQKPMVLLVVVAAVACGGDRRDENPDGDVSVDADLDVSGERDSELDADGEVEPLVDGDGISPDADLDHHVDGDVDELHELVFPDAEWQTLSPEEAGMSSGLLDAGLVGLPGNIVVVRFGYVVATRGDPSEPLPLYSVGKSLTALVFGVLLEAGLVSLDDLVPGSDYPSSPQATFRQFLSMTSDYGLTPHSPGDHYAYNNAAVQFYGEHMRETFFDGSSPEAILDDQVLATIGRQDPLTFDGWWSGWDGGFIASARDMARVGLLVLARGSWEGTQVVPASFVDELYESQIPPDATMSTSTGMDSGTNNRWNQQHITAEMMGSYSFGFWINAAREHPDLPREVTHASGYNGNRIIVCPPYQLVVAVVHDGSGTYPDWDAYLRPVIAAVDGDVDLPEVARLVLVDADRDVDIGPLSDGDTLDLGSLPTTSLNVRAETTPAAVGSVRFSLDGVTDYRTENVAPYSLAGDDGGDYAPWTPGIGSHTVSVTAYTGPDGTGAAGEPSTVRFDVL